MSHILTNQTTIEILNELVLTNRISLYSDTYKILFMKLVPGDTECRYIDATIKQDDETNRVTRLDVKADEINILIKLERN